MPSGAATSRWSAPNSASGACRNPRDLRRGGTVDPWWFETGAQWGDGVAYPKGLEQRYRSFFLDRAFGSFDAFIAATQWFQFAGLKYQIEKLRSSAPRSKAMSSPS